MTIEIRAGQTWPTNSSGFLSVVEYRGSEDVDVVFIKTGYRTTARAGNIRDGRVKDKLYPSVCDMGFVGGGGYKPSVGGVITEQYITWNSMLRRCYSDDYQLKQPAYIGCSVCSDWLNFQNFADWFDNHYIEGHHLDKDLLLQGNKVYSPETCVFVTNSLNNLLTDSGVVSRNLPLGVIHHGTGFAAQVWVQGTQLRKTFRTVPEAVKFYKHHKAKEIRRQAHLPTTPDILMRPLLDRADALEQHQ